MEDYYAHRNSGHRYIINKVDDDGKIQLIDAEGLKDEKHTKIMRVYPHGFHSVSVEDSHMLAIGLGGRRDLLVALGGEHPDHRPRKLAPGYSIFYDKDKNCLRLVEASGDFTHGKKIKISIGQGLKDGESSGGEGGGEGGESAGVTAEAGEDKDVTITLDEDKIVITKGDAVIELTEDNLTLTKGSSVTTMEDGKIKHKADKVVIESDDIKLGSEGASLPVGLCGGGCATKVYAE